MEGRGGAWKWVGRSFGFASTPNAGLLRAGHADASENLILQPPTLDPDTFLPRRCGKACPSFGVPGPLFSARPQGTLPRGSDTRGRARGLYEHFTCT